MKVNVFLQLVLTAGRNLTGSQNLLHEDRSSRKSCKGIATRH